MGSDNVSYDRQAPAIAEYFSGMLEKYNCVEKRVIQTYDGASVMASGLNGVQAKIKEKVPEAVFTHVTHTQIEPCTVVFSKMHA